MMRHLALSSLALALLTGTAFAQTQQFGTVNVLDAFNLNRSKTGTPNCASTDGQYASDNTKSWEPSCFGTFISNGATKVYPTRGTAQNPDLTPNSNGFASLLVQFQSNGAVAKESNGIFVNADVVGGSVSAGSLDTTNTTGQLISLRQRPGPNGEKPPSTWGHNVDLHIAPGAGNVLSFGVEYDQNNFNKDCGPGSNCISSAMFFNGLSGWPNTAWLFSGNGNVAERLVGVSIAGGAITRTNGDFFSPATSLVVLDGTEYRVRYVSQDRVDAEVPIPDRATAGVSWRNAATHYGVLWVGNDNIQDAGFSDGSSSRVAFQAANRHHIGLDTTGGVMPYAVTAAAEQRVCLDGMDSCFSRTGGVTAFEANGGRPLEIVANTDPRSGLRITGQTADSGPILEPTAAGGPNVPLNIRARGNKEVQFHSPAIAYGGVSIRGGAGADFRDMQGFAETIRMRDGQIVTWDQSRIFQFGGWLYFGSANGASNWMRINTGTGQVETKLPIVQNAGM